MSIKANCAYARQLLPLLGGKVTQIIVDDSDPYGNTFMGLIIEVGKKQYQVIGLSDAEGNGACFLEIVETTNRSTVTRGM